MSKTRYGHTNVAGGNQDQGERKDEGWESRQGGSQSRQPGSRGEPEPRQAAGRDRESSPPQGTNTQGGLAGIADASRETLDQRSHGRADGEASSEIAGERAGTDQPRRMGGPLGPDPKHPHLPEGAQDGESRGTGAGGFDRGVDASTVGAVHQGVRPEDNPDE